MGFVVSLLLGCWDGLWGWLLAYGWLCRGLLPAPESRQVPPKAAQVQAFGLEDDESSFRLEMVNGAGLLGQGLEVCRRQVGGHGLTQAVVRLKCPA